MGEQNLVALQGPGAAAVLSKLLSPADAETLPKMAFMHGRPMNVLGVSGCIVTRCGYTGEDGFEISMPPTAAVRITNALLEGTGVAPAGLGPRDSLRLEAGLCLYGHDIDTNVTPGEAVLGWTIGKRRRQAGGFLGSDYILKQLNEKSVQRKRVGLSIEGAPAREGAVIYAPAAGSNDVSAATKIGVVTSGTFSPCLKAPIAMGYVTTPHSAEGTRLAVEVRGKLIPAKVTKMPFVPNGYYKPK
jgi:aminomethyltransferase